MPAADTEQPADRDPLALSLRQPIAPRARRDDRAGPRDPTQTLRATLITFLTEREIDALINAPDAGNWTGRRDRAMLMLAAQTGLRASELLSLTVADVHLGTGAHVSCFGKGRKQRITPLTKTTTTLLRAWLAERGGQPTDPLFPTIRGRPLSRDAL